MKYTIQIHKITTTKKNDWYQCITIRLYNQECKIQTVTVLWQPGSCACGKISLSKAEMWCWIIAEAMRHNRHQVPLITCCQRGLSCYLLATRFCHESGLGLPIRKPRRPIWKCHLQAQPMVSHSLRNIHGAKAITFLIELFSHCDNAKGLFCTDTIICIQPMFQKNLFMRILSKLMCEIGSFSIEGQWQCVWRCSVI